MAAFGAPGFPLGLGGPPAAVPGAAAAAPVGAPPVPAVGFTDAIMGGIAMGVDASGYELRYNVYTASLEPSLRFYDPPAAPPGARVPAAAAPAAPVGRGVSLALIKRNLQLPISPLKILPNNWSGNRIKSLVDSAAAAVPDVPGAVFDQNAFAIAILPQLNDLALQNARRDRAPALAAPIAITRANIGI